MANSSSEGCSSLQFDGGGGPHSITKAVQLGNTTPVPVRSCAQAGRALLAAAGCPLTSTGAPARPASSISGVAAHFCAYSPPTHQHLRGVGGAFSITLVPSAHEWRP